MNTEATVTKMNIAELTALVLELQTKVVALEQTNVSKKATQTTGKEMTDAHAMSVTYGEHAALKHQAAADALGLSYGQIYSCRLEFTFKAVHAAQAKANVKNVWAK